MRRCLPALMLVLCVTILSACGEPPAPKASDKTLRIVETYGKDSARSVTIDAGWYRASDDALELATVSVSIAPGEQPMVQKLETLLAETGFTWRKGSDDWPLLSRSAPPEAIPMIQRLQLALLLLEGPERFEVSRPYVSLFSNPPSMGLTTVTREGDKVSLHSLALALTEGDSTLAWAQAEGTKTPEGFTLIGQRRVGAQSAEQVTTTIQRTSAQD